MTSSNSSTAKSPQATQPAEPRSSAEPSSVSVDGRSRPETRRSWAETGDYADMQSLAEHVLDTPLELG